MTRVGVLFSGGKDSTYVCEQLIKSDFEIGCLISIKSENPNSYMLHTPNIEITKLSAEAMGLSLFSGFTAGEKELEIEQIKETIIDAKSKYNLDAIAAGGISSIYQKSRLEAIAKYSELDLICPIWGVDQKEYLRIFGRIGYNAIITSVSCGGLDDTFLAARLDSELIERIISLSQKYGFNPSFEGGEAETLVLECPLFGVNKIKLIESRKHWDGYSGWLEILNARLENSTNT